MLPSLLLLALTVIVAAAAVAQSAAVSPANPVSVKMSDVAFWASGPRDMWIVSAVGSNSALSHFDGVTWSRTQVGSVHVNALWGSGPRDVWAVGSVSVSSLSDEGAVLHWNGTTWSRVPTPVTQGLGFVGGCSASDVWAIGTAPEEGQPPAVLHWDGRSWTNLSGRVAFFLRGAAFACPDLIVVGGANVNTPSPDFPEGRSVGVLMRRHAGEWTYRGWNGAAISDTAFDLDQLDGAASGGGVSLVIATTTRQDRRVLASNATGDWHELVLPSYQSLGPDAADGAVLTVAGDGMLLAVAPNGYARWSGARWSTHAHAPRCVRPDECEALFGSGGHGIWAPAGNDFYVVALADDPTGQFRIVRIVDDVVQVVYGGTVAAR